MPTSTWFDAKIALSKCDEPREAELGWHRVRKGLFIICLGHILWIVTIPCLAMLAWHFGSALPLEEGTAQDRIGHNADPEREGTAGSQSADEDRKAVLSSFGFDVLGFVRSDRSVTVSEKVDWNDLGLTFTLCVIFGVLALCAAIVLHGQWHCLYAPERHGAKSLMFGSTLCLGMGLSLIVASCFVGGWGNWENLSRGWTGLSRFHLMSAAGMLQATSALLSLAGIVFFHFFVRAVYQCFYKSSANRGMDLCLSMFVFVACGTLVLIHELPGFDPATGGLLLIGLGFAWFAWLIWHILIVLDSRECVRVGVLRYRAVGVNRIRARLAG